MKNFYSVLMVAGMLLVVPFFSQAQNTRASTKKTITVLNLDSKGLSLDPAQMGNLARLELDKLDTFQVMDRYDATYLIEKNKLNIGNCYGKLCLVEIGSVLKSDKMMSGSVELYGESIIITIRLIDVSSASVEKTQVKEFLNLPKEVQKMIGITLREMFGRKNDQTLLTTLTKPFNYENAVNNPNKERLDLSGSRMGFTVFSGEPASILATSKSNGGFDALPMMFQFGYQFEQQYLNEGNFQALFEFIPLITGLDQGMFIPSITIMNGIRNNRNGLEFAFGPTLSLVKKADVYNVDGHWYLEDDWNEKDSSNTLLPIPYAIERRLDSRGEPALSTGFVFAFGRTFKSGKLNIPVNAYVIPSRNGLRFGASFGFNAKN